MTELDHAPADTATQAASPDPAGEQRPGSPDSQTRYPHAVGAADTDPGYYDGDIQAALAADTTPTRQQAARGAAGGPAGDDTATTPDNSPADGRDADTEAILHENDELPDSRTRQQAARDATAHDHAEFAPAASHDTPASQRDPDIEAILHENDSLPDPRTRQPAARDAAAETSAASGNDSPATAGERPQSGPDPSAEASGNDKPGAADPGDRASPDPGAAEGDGHDNRFAVVEIGPDERTFGDTTPTGIGLKPTGDQIIEMEDNKASRAERARKEFLSGERLGDAFDATDEWAKTGQDLFTRPPTGQHVEIPVQGPFITSVPHQEIDPGSMATAGLAVGILGAEFFRWGKHKVEHMRGRHSASDR